MSRPLKKGYIPRRLASGRRMSDGDEEDLQVITIAQRPTDIKKLHAENGIVDDSEPYDDSGSDCSDDEIEEAMQDEEQQDTPIVKYVKSAREKLDKALDKKIILVAADAFDNILFYRERIQVVVKEIKRKIMRIGMSNVLHVAVHPHAHVVRVPSTLKDDSTIHRRVEGCVWIVSEHVPLAHFPQRWGRCTAAYKTTGALSDFTLQYDTKWKIQGHDVDIEDMYGLEKHTRKTARRATLNESTEVRTAEGSGNVLVCTTHDAAASHAVETRIATYTVGNFYTSDTYNRCVSNSVFQNTRTAYAASHMCFKSTARSFNISKEKIGVLTPKSINFTDLIMPYKSGVQMPREEEEEEEEEENEDEEKSVDVDTKAWFAVYSNVFPTHHIPLPNTNTHRDAIKLGSMVYMGTARGFVEFGSSGEPYMVPRYDMGYREKDIREDILQKSFSSRIECRYNDYGFATCGIYTGDLNKAQLPNLMNIVENTRRYHAGPTFIRNVSGDFIGDLCANEEMDSLNGLFKHFDTYLLHNTRPLSKLNAYATEGGFSLFGSINCYRMTIHSTVRAFPPERGFMVPLANIHALSNQIFIIAAENYKQGALPAKTDKPETCLLQFYTHGGVTFDSRTRMGPCVIVSERWLRDVYCRIVKTL